MPCTQTAFNTELSLTEKGQAPTWIELLPAANAQNKIIGRDGREWIWDAAAQRDVLTAFTRRGVDLALDWEHASQHRAVHGEDAPAAGWIDQLDIRNGALYGRVTWTPRGREQVQNREYRFVSPVFHYSPESTRIAQVISVGLTNLPNLHLPALNAEGMISPHEDLKMSRTAELAAGIAALGLPADADDAAIATAINTIKTERDTALATAKNAEQQQPSLSLYVPRADYEVIKARAENAEQTLRVRDEAAHTAAVDAAIDAAVKAGKIAPVSVEYYRAQCREEKGLKDFQAFVSTAPVIGGDSGLDNKKPQTETAINSEELSANARAYIAEQKALGIEISADTAVQHLMKTRISA